DENSKRPEIEYPCNWDYKIIGTDVSEMIKVIEEAVGDLTYDLSPSNISKKGNYFSLNLTVYVPSEIVRDLIFRKVSSSAFVKIVF
uniref:HP0495 family protein n=1 Tax=Ignavibacterium sp. TaxID=2651167 RepID=UPI00307CDBA6